MSLKDNLELEENESVEGNYMALGMAFGTLAGCVGMAVLAMFGQLVWGALSICAGLFGGMIIGMLIPKKDKKG